MSTFKAIAAKCRDCIYDPLSRGTWREQITACDSANCPLFDFRPLMTGLKRSDPEFVTKRAAVVAKVTV